MRCSLKSITFVLSLAPLLAFGQQYRITDLGSNGWSYSETHGMNGLGNVVGEYEATNSISVRAFWFNGSGMVDLGTLAGMPYAIGYGINDISQSVGESDTGINTHAFSYQNGAIHDLGSLGGITGYSSAHGINHQGQIVGESSISFSRSSTIHAVLFGTGGATTDLGALGGDYSSASAINGSGVIVGESDIVQAGVTNVHAFVFTNGVSTQMTDLGTLGGNYSSAKGVNDSGVIVGEAETVIGGGTYLRGFIWSNHSMSPIGTFGGNTSSASSINSAGQVVGYATDVSENSLAFLYDGSTLINLNDRIPPGSGWNLTSADAINDAGQIAGSGYLADGSYHAYLLTPANPLTVAITNPAPNSVFQAPGTFAIGASTSDSAGTVTNVQFLVDTTVIGNSTTPPFSATASNLAAGSYTLTAVASDDAGLRATNSISITVTNAQLAPTTLLNPAFNGTSFSFSFATQVGYMYEGQFCTPLSTNWLTFTNLSGNGSTVRVTDPSATNGQSFYRVAAH